MWNSERRKERKLEPSKVQFDEITNEDKWQELTSEILDGENVLVNPLAEGDLTLPSLEISKKRSVKRRPKNNTNNVSTKAVTETKQKTLSEAFSESEMQKMFRTTTQNEKVNCMEDESDFSKLYGSNGDNDVNVDVKRFLCDDDDDDDDDNYHNGEHIKSIGFVNNNENDDDDNNYSKRALFEKNITGKGTEDKKVKSALTDCCSKRCCNTSSTKESSVQRARKLRCEDKLHKTIHNENTQKLYKGETPFPTEKTDVKLNENIYACGTQSKTVTGSNANEKESIALTNNSINNNVPKSNGPGYLEQSSKDHY